MPTDDVWMKIKYTDGPEVHATVPSSFVQWVRQQDARTRTAFAARMTDGVRGLLRELQDMVCNRQLTEAYLRRADSTIKHFGPSNWEPEEGSAT